MDRSDEIRRLELKGYEVRARLYAAQARVLKIRTEEKRAAAEVRSAADRFQQARHAVARYCSNARPGERAHALTEGQRVVERLDCRLSRAKERRLELGRLALREREMVVLGQSRLDSIDGRRSRIEIQRHERESSSAGEETTETQSAMRASELWNPAGSAFPADRVSAFFADTANVDASPAPETQSLDASSKGPFEGSQDLVVEYTSRQGDRVQVSVQERPGGAAAFVLGPEAGRAARVLEGSGESIRAALCERGVRAKSVVIARQRERAR